MIFLCWTLDFFVGLKSLYRCPDLVAGHLFFEDSHCCPKDKFDQDLSTGVVYKISCKDCEKVYIGQTSRALKSRTREHKRAVFTGDKNFLHCAQTNHDFNFDDVEIVDRCSQWSHRMFLEAWHSIREPNSINEHVHVPEMYKILANP